MLHMVSLNVRDSTQQSQHKVTTDVTDLGNLLDRQHIQETWNYEIPLHRHFFFFRKSCSYGHTTH